MRQGAGAGQGPQDGRYPGYRADGAGARKTSFKPTTICTAGKLAFRPGGGLSFDHTTASGKLMRTIMTGLAEFERGQIRERVKSRLASARSRGVRLGRQID